jgi:hypothetical protein
MTPFDPNIDYFAKLKSSEIYTDDDSKSFVFLRGLQRLARERGIKSIDSVVAASPTSGAPIAAVTIKYTFDDGRSYAGSADASMKNTDAPYNLHLVAVAESKAEARALRRAFGIAECSYEELGVNANPDNKPISDTQIRAIRGVAERKSMSDAAILALIGLGPDASLNSLTKADGKEVMKKLNKAKRKVKAG